MISTLSLSQSDITLVHTFRVSGTDSCAPQARNLTLLYNQLLELLECRSLCKKKVFLPEAALLRAFEVEGPAAPADPTPVSIF